MRKRNERLVQRRARADMRHRMEKMIDEANALRDEAAKKVDGVPKGYKLNTWRDDLRNFSLTAGELVMAMVWLGLFVCSLEDEHWSITVWLTVILATVMAIVGIVKTQPYRVEEHIQDYCVGNFWYEALSRELGRLEDGIAEYDRQYAEQEEYILKFKEQCVEFGDFGCMTLCLKAGNFHAHVKIKTDMDEVDCKLKFNEEGYKKLMDILAIFNQSA